MSENGRLTVARTYDIDVGDETMWSIGMVPAVKDQVNGTRLQRLLRRPNGGG